MPDLDERVRQTADWLSTSVEPAAFDRVVHRRRRRRTIRHVQTIALILTVLGGTVGGSLLLLKAFDSGQPAASPSPPTLPQATNGVIAFVSHDGDDDIAVVDPTTGFVTPLTSDPSNERSPDWSPDGTRLAFVSDRDGGNDDIYVMNADGSGRQRLTDDTAIDDSPSWSPDGSMIAFTSNRWIDGHQANHQLWVMNADGSGQHRVTPDDVSIDHASRPSWSPDGRELLFVAVSPKPPSNCPPDASCPPGLAFQIDAVELTGANLRPLSATTEAHNPSWSHDGSRILFTLGGRIALKDARTAKVRELTSGRDLDGSPVWSPDGTRIAFTRVIGGEGSPHLFEMNPDGAGVAEITSEISDATTPAWQPVPVQPSQSPSSEPTDELPENGKILFIAFEKGKDRLFTVNPDGTGLTVMDTPLGPPRNDGSYAAMWTGIWSPDGSQFLYLNPHDEGVEPVPYELHVLNADGTDEHVVSIDNVAEAAWSPDGTRIAFFGVDAQSIFVVSVADETTTQLTFAGPGCFDEAPSWSLDGKHIAYAHACGDEMPSLTVMAADGSGQREIASGIRFAPAWSPDGTGITFVGADHQIYVVEPVGGDSTRLTSSGPHGQPVWSPDGTQIAFSDLDAGVWRMDADGSAVTLLAGAQHGASVRAWFSVDVTLLPTPTPGPGGSDCFNSEVVGDFDGDGLEDDALVYPAKEMTPPDCDPGSFSVMRQVVEVSLSSGATISYEFVCGAILCEAQGWRDDEGFLHAPDFDGDGRDELAVNVSQGSSFSTFAVYRVSEDEGLVELDLVPPADPAVGLDPGPIRLTIASSLSSRSTVVCDRAKGVVVWINQPQHGGSIDLFHERQLSFDGTRFRIVYSLDQPRFDGIEYPADGLASCADEP